LAAKKSYWETKAGKTQALEQSLRGTRSELCKKFQAGADAAVNPKQNKNHED
jgi:hypothetical protein